MNPSGSLGATSAFQSGGFGSSSSAFGQKTGAFGSSSKSATFGSTTAFGAPAQTTFGSSNASTGHSFGASTVFGGAKTTPNLNASAVAFGTSQPTTVFGSSATPKTIFGTSNQQSTPASTTAGFGNGSFGQSTNLGVFGATSSTASTTFGATSTTPAFGSAKETTFGSASSTVPFGAASTTKFGSSNATSSHGKSAPSSGNPFANPAATFTGSASTPAFGVASTTTGAFGSSPPEATIFGSKPVTTVFGSGIATASAEPFGAGSAPSTVFGSASSTTFGSAAPETTTIFGNKSTPSSKTFGSSSSHTTTFGKGTPKSTKFGADTSKPTPFGGKSMESAPFGSKDSDLGSISAPSKSFERAFGGKSLDTEQLGGQSLKKATNHGALKGTRKEPPPKRLPPQSLDTSAPLPLSSPEVSPTHKSDELEIEKANLSNAINIDGLCIDMCSPKEREQQIRFDDLSTFEKGNPPESFIIKRFQRAAASHKLDIPSEIRPLGVLRRTQLYLEQNIIDLDKRGVDDRFNPPRVPDFLDLYQFFWNRARMIRNDFTLQNYRGGGRYHQIAMDVHERIARFYILCEHELIENINFVEQQNMEQLGKTMKSLQDFYDDAKLCGDETSSFEAEFAGYFILLHLDKNKTSDVLKFTKELSFHLLKSNFVQFAMDCFISRNTNNYVEFFKLLKKATLLQSCLLHRYLPSVRSDALECMNRVYRQPYPLNELTQLLCFENDQQTAEICQHHGLLLVENDQAIGFGSDTFETDTELRMNNRKIPITCSYRCVSSKQEGWLRRDICRGATEYSEESYPLLSRKIYEAENQERQRLYPTRPPYDDPFSRFMPQGVAPVVPVLVHPPPKRAIPPPSTPKTPSLPPTQAKGSPQSESPQKILTNIEGRQRTIELEKKMLLDEIERRKKALEEKKPQAGSPALHPQASPPAVEAIETSPEKRLAIEAAEKAKQAAEKERKDREEAESRRKAAEEKRKREEAEERRKAEEKRAQEEAARKARELELQQEKARKEAKEAERRAEETRRKLEKEKREEEIKALSVYWLKTNFELHETIQVRIQRYNANAEANYQQQLAKAQLQLRFAMWRNHIKKKQELRVPQEMTFTPSATKSSEFVQSRASWLGIPRNIPQWTPFDANLSTRAHDLLMDMREELLAPFDMLPIIARGVLARYKSIPLIEYSIGISTLRGDKASEWLGVKLGTALIDTQTQRIVQNGQTFILHRTNELASANSIVGAVTAHDVASLENSIHQTQLMLKSKQTLYLLVVSPQSMVNLLKKHAKSLGQSNLHLHVTSWDAAHGTLVKLAEEIGQRSRIISTTQVNLRNALDDILQITLYQSSSLVTSLLEIALHVHDAYCVFLEIIEKCDPKAEAIQYVKEICNIPLPRDTSQSSVAWIQQLPLDPLECTLCMKLVDDAWQQNSSPFKTIVSTVYEVFFDQMELESIGVILPSTWVVECQQLLGILPHTMPRHIFPIKRKVSALLDPCYISPPLKVPSIRTINETTRYELQKKWRQEAMLQEIEQERNVHQKYMRMLHVEISQE